MILDNVCLYPLHILYYIILFYFFIKNFSFLQWRYIWRWCNGWAYSWERNAVTVRRTCPMVTARKKSWGRMVKEEMAGRTRKKETRRTRCNFFFFFHYILVVQNLIYFIIIFDFQNLFKKKTSLGWLDINIEIRHYDINI